MRGAVKERIRGTLDATAASRSRAVTSDRGSAEAVAAEATIKSAGTTAARSAAVGVGAGDNDLPVNENITLRKNADWGVQRIFVKPKDTAAIDRQRSDFEDAVRW